MWQSFSKMKAKITAENILKSFIPRLEIDSVESIELEMMDMDAGFVSSDL